MCLILKGFSNASQKFLMSDAFNQLALKHIKFSYLGFLNDFHCVLLASFFFLRKDYTPESTFSEILSTLVILWASCIVFPFWWLLDFVFGSVNTWARLVGFCDIIRLEPWSGCIVIMFRMLGSWSNLWLVWFFLLGTARYITHNWYYTLSQRKQHKLTNLTKILHFLSFFGIVGSREQTDRLSQY